MTKYFKPISTLAVGMVLGYVVVPKVMSRVGG
jgi:hypothetical protein